MWLIALILDTMSGREIEKTAAPLYHYFQDRVGSQHEPRPRLAVTFHTLPQHILENTLKYHVAHFELCLFTWVEERVSHREN
jgi:hypothetical protein